MPQLSSLLVLGIATNVLWLGLAQPAPAGEPTPGSYDFTLVASTAEKDVAGLGGGAINADGHVTFESMDSAATSSVHVFDGVDVTALASGATSPVINAAGDVAYLAESDAGNIAVFVYSRNDGLSTEVYAAPDVLSLGQLSLNAGGELAFWQLECEVTCADVNHEIYSLSGVDTQLIASALSVPGSPASVTGPVVNATGVIAYRRGEAGMASIELFDGTSISIITEIQDGLLSYPSLNDAATVVYFASDALTDAGIYAVPAVRATPKKVVPLDGDLTPSVHATPFINNLDQIAFTAIEEESAGVYVAQATEIDAPVQRVLQIGDSLFGASVSGTPQVLGLSDAGQVLFKVALDDSTTAIGIATPVDIVCPGDLNGDAVVNVTDLLSLLAAWGPCAGCDEDLSGDDVVNVTDLLQLLAAWGECR